MLYIRCKKEKIGFFFLWSKTLTAQFVFPWKAGGFLLCTYEWQDTIFNYYIRDNSEGERMRRIPHKSM